MMNYECWMLNENRERSGPFIIHHSEISIIHSSAPPRIRVSVVHV